MRTSTMFAAALVLAALLPLHAQDGKRSGSATNAYLVEYRIRDGGATAANPATERHYSLMVNGEHKAVFKVGDRIPAVNGMFEPVNANSMVTTQYTYLDVGVNIECTLLELDSRVEVHTTIDLSALEKETAPTTTGVHNPSIKETKLDASTTLQIGKPTLLASIADPATNRMLQVSVTVSAAN